MQLRGQTVSEVPLMLRIFVMLALIFALYTTHSATIDLSDGSSTVTINADQAQGQMGDPNSNHSKLKRSFCAPHCVGMDRLETGIVVGRIDRIVVTAWYEKIDPVWTVPIPDPALRPPDLLHHT